MYMCILHENGKKEKKLADLCEKFSACAGRREKAQSKKRSSTRRTEIARINFRPVEDEAAEGGKVESKKVEIVFNEIFITTLIEVVIKCLQGGRMEELIRLLQDSRSLSKPCHAGV